MSQVCGKDGNSTDTHAKEREAEAIAVWERYQVDLTHSRCHSYKKHRSSLSNTGLQGRWIKQNYLKASVKFLSEEIHRECRDLALSIAMQEGGSLYQVVDAAGKRFIEITIDVRKPVGSGYEKDASGNIVQIIREITRVTVRLEYSPISQKWIEITLFPDAVATRHGDIVEPKASLLSPK